MPPSPSSNSSISSDDQALIEQANAARPGKNDPAGSGDEFNRLVALLDVNLDALSRGKGPDSPEAEALRRELNHLKYVKSLKN